MLPFTTRVAAATVLLSAFCCAALADPQRIGGRFTVGESSLPYRHPVLKYLGSDAPIPGPLARCLRHIELSYEALAHHLNRLVGTDLAEFSIPGFQEIVDEEIRTDVRLFPHEGVESLSLLRAELVKHQSVRETARGELDKVQRLLELEHVARNALAAEAPPRLEALGAQERRVREADDAVDHWGKLGILQDNIIAFTRHRIDYIECMLQLRSDGVGE